MKRLAIAVSVVATLALAPGSASARVPTGKYRATITSGFLKGNWTMDFYKRGSYKVTGPFGFLTGRTSFKGSTITYSRESEGTLCPGPGTYRFTLTGRKLKLTKIRESCKVRPKVHVRTWTKVS